jgi:hypothetical protein
MTRASSFPSVYRRPPAMPLPGLAVLLAAAAAAVAVASSTAAAQPPTAAAR